MPEKQYNKYVPDYYDNWEEEDYSCLYCDWSGKGAELQHGELFSDLVELVTLQMDERQDAF